MSPSVVPTRGISLLTGVRGLAALVVFISHAAIVGYLPAVFGHGFGQVGVMLFFLLSGFLMAQLYLQRPFDSAAGDYVRARLARVLPLYYVILVISVVMTSGVYTDFRYVIGFNDPGTLARAALLGQAPFELWTIPVEVQFYAAFLITWYLYSRIGRTALAILAGAAVVGLGFMIGVLGETTTILPTFGFAFVAGVFASRLRPLIQRNAARIPAAAGIILLVLLILNTPGIRDAVGLALVDPDQIYTSTWLDPLTWIIVLAFFTCCLADSPSLQFLNNRVFTYVGEISYGLYLIHYPVLEIVRRLVDQPVVGLVLSFAISLGLATLSFRYFETPVMRAVRGRRRSASA